MLASYRRLFRPLARSTEKLVGLALGSLLGMMALAMEEFKKVEVEEEKLVQ